MMLDGASSACRWSTTAATLVGIVTRADLVRAFVRSDADVEQEIREDVIRRALWIESRRRSRSRSPAARSGSSGEVETKADAELIPEFVQRVPGVDRGALEAALAASENGAARRDRQLSSSRPWSIA